MRSHVEVRAEAGAGGTTELVRMSADGALAVRRTGPGRVHLVGTAAGPLGGDVVTVDVRVGPGARLRVESVAATVALPGSVPAPGRWDVRLDVAAGGRLEYLGQPLVVCRAAHLLTTTTAALAAGASLDLTEQVLLGRHGEDGGTWEGRLVVVRDGLPVLRQTTTSGVLASRPSPARALASRFTTDDLPAATASDAVTCPLAAGGTLLTAYGATLSEASARLEPGEQVALDA